TAESATTVAAISQQLRLPDTEVAAAAGLPDQSTLAAGKALHFTQGATGIRIGPQYDFTENRSEPLLTAFRHGFRTTFDSLKLARNEIISWVKGGSKPAISGPIG